MITATQATDISNLAIGLVAGVPLVTFLVASAAVMFRPELLALVAWLSRRVPQVPRRVRRWHGGVKRDLRIALLEWLSYHRFSGVAAWLGLSPREFATL